MVISFGAKMPHFYEPVARYHVDSDFSNEDEEEEGEEEEEEGEEADTGNDELNSDFLTGYSGSRSGLTGLRTGFRFSTGRGTGYHPHFRLNGFSSPSSDQLIANEEGQLSNQLPQQQQQQHKFLFPRKRTISPTDLGRSQLILR